MLPINKPDSMSALKLPLPILKAASRFTLNDETDIRQILRYASIFHEEGHAMIVATDGRWIGIFRVSSEPFKPMLIDLSDVRWLEGDEAEITVNTLVVRVRSDGREIISQDPHLIGLGSFPNVRKVLLEPHKPSDVVCLNPYYLKRIADVMEDLELVNCGVSVSATGPGRTVILGITKPQCGWECFIALMPMEYSDGREIKAVETPGWLSPVISQVTNTTNETQTHITET